MGLAYIINVNSLCRERNLDLSAHTCGDSDYFQVPGMLIIGFWFFLCRQHCKRKTSVVGITSSCMALPVNEKFMNEVHQLSLTHGYSKLFHVVTPRYVMLL